MSELFDATARVEQIIWIPGAVVDPDSLPEAFDDFCECLDADRLDAPLFAALPELIPFVEDESLEFGVAAEALKMKQRTGFLVQAATPVMKHNGDGCSFSWGHYHTEWLYADTADQIEPIIVAWAEHKHEKDRPRAGP